MRVMALDPAIFNNVVTALLVMWSRIKRGIFYEFYVKFGRRSVVAYLMVGLLSLFVKTG
jgi:hypothetical protein